LCAQIDPEEILEKNYAPFFKNQQFIPKNGSQMIGNFKNGFAFLNTFLVKLKKLA
jgi:hypothetical protein